MKYKVILVADTPIGGSPDSTVTFSFYTRAAAEACCNAWVESYSQRTYLWDGVSWIVIQ